MAEAKADQLEVNGQTKGMVMDFGDLKNVLKVEADYFDHSLIYEQKTLREKTIEALKEEGFRLIEVGFRPTAENFSKYFYDRLKKKGISVCCVTVYETPNNCAQYMEEK